MIRRACTIAGAARTAARAETDRQVGIAIGEMLTPGLQVDGLRQFEPGPVVCTLEVI